MVQKSARKKTGSRLSLKPALEAEYVREQLEASLPRVPEQLIEDVVKTGEPSRLRKVSDALEQISISAGNKAKETLALFQDEGLSAMLVANPKEFARMAKAAMGLPAEAFKVVLHFKDEFSKEPKRITDAIVRIAEATRKDTSQAFNPQGLMFLHNLEPIAEAFSKNPEEVSRAFASIFNTYGAESKYAFWTLIPFAEAFAKNPAKAAETFSEISRLCGRRRKSVMDAAFGLAKFVEGDFTKDFNKLQKLAETAAYSSLIYSLKEAVSQENVDQKGEAAVKGEVRVLLSLLDSPETLIEEYGMGCLPDYRDKWEEGRDLAFSAGITFEDREVFINFAYAKETIGAQKTRAIYREYGIEYFARYSKKELESLYEHIGEKEDNRPLLLIANNKSDRNGGFYGDMVTRSPLTGGGKHNKYNVIIFEAETEGEFYEKARKFGEKYFGISVLIIGGHGRADSIALGPGDSEENKLDLSDIEELKKLHGLFAENPRVILDSCSTGANEKAIGAAISSAWGAYLFAPAVPTYVEEFVLNNDGSISGVLYAEGGRKFLRGKEMPGKQ
ncbi:hypothetical protein JW721_02600 [Candidatus Micrarchaeota archaeon]|nr:hypothetical protein [Candidatus Micrarchaeota archaeon]